MSKRTVLERFGIFAFYLKWELNGGEREFPGKNGNAINHYLQ